MTNTYVEGNDFGTEWFCKDCRYSAITDDPEPIGQCRFNPPVYIEGRQYGLAAFPKVNLNYGWCAKGRTFNQPEQGFPK